MGRVSATEGLLKSTGPFPALNLKIGGIGVGADDSQKVDLAALRRDDEGEQELLSSLLISNVPVYTLYSNGVMRPGASSGLLQITRYLHVEEDVRRGRLFCDSENRGSGVPWTLGESQMRIGYDLMSSADAISSPSLEHRVSFRRDSGYSRLFGEPARDFDELVHDLQSENRSLIGMLLMNTTDHDKVQYVTDWMRRRNSGLMEKKFLDLENEGGLTLRDLEEHYRERVFSYVLTPEGSAVLAGLW